MNDSALTCTECGSTNIAYNEQIVSTRHVIEVVDGSLKVGKAQEENVIDSGFRCLSCTKAQPHLDDYDREILD